MPHAFRCTSLFRACIFYLNRVIFLSYYLLYARIIKGWSAKTDVPADAIVLYRFNRTNPLCRYFNENLDADLSFLQYVDMASPAGLGVEQNLLKWTVRLTIRDSQQFSLVL